jgi:SPP1 family predicted phage head-tail adaptor
VIDPGKLRHVVQLRMPIRQRNETGEEVDVWQTVAKDVRAAVEPVTGRELFAGAQVQAVVTHKVTLWYRPGFDARGQILHEGRALSAVFVRDEEDRHEYLEVLCVENATA